MNHDKNLENLIIIKVFNFYKETNSYCFKKIKLLKEKILLRLYIKASI